MLSAVKGRRGMKVILLKDVKALGKKGQVVEVSEGYANNFLLKTKSAVPANAQNMNVLKTQEGSKMYKRERDFEEAKRLAEKIQSFVRMYASQISGNEEIARHFGYHPVYIATVFKNETGRTLHSAITEQRMADACRWLMQTNASIDEIAVSTGFSSRPHFCTVFKKHTGLTPNEWRNKKD